MRWLTRSPLNIKKICVSVAYPPNITEENNAERTPVVIKSISMPSALVVIKLKKLYFSLYNNKTLLYISINNNFASNCTSYGPFCCSCFWQEPIIPGA